MLLFAIQLAHFLIYVAALAMLAGMAVYALSGRLARYIPLFLGYPLAILAGYLANGNRCILQTWARALTGVEDGWARDILFLPEIVAVNTMAVCIPVFVLAALAVIARWALTRRAPIS
ncbi:hypothetical protein F1654_08315 [Alkalicaulis satelles]|uniref:DUF2784 domain-containing protein n=1 Tax=Alkalicaulis satelles TaxID=2609175 RepID=A0A5M6ZGC5_9PROT|nr:hypothetical protein [Alkalicaulis satelles]KAA5803793.1 hypothetical protein F1654_08315 [Alkalicaulis satelles]